jgi:hypothetical protein
MIDKDVGVELVDKNPNDIVLLQILDNGPSTTIHTYKSYDINGYTFYARTQDNKSVNQNSSVRIDAYDCDGNRKTYYGFIEEICELEYRENLKVPLFRCQWVGLPNVVKVDKYGMTTVNFKIVGYREQPFVLAKDVTQVFYIKDPANKEGHIIFQKLLALRMLLTRKTITSLSLSLSLMTPRNLHTYVMIATKLSLLNERICHVIN